MPLAPLPPLRPRSGGTPTATPVREAAGGGHWITLHAADSDEGTVHVFIGGNGRVTKGPSSLVGSAIGHLASHPSVKSAQHHPPGHEPPGAKSHPAYSEHQPPEKPAPLPGKPYARLHGAPQTRQEQPKEGPQPLTREQTHAGLQQAREQLKVAQSGERGTEGASRQDSNLLSRARLERAQRMTPPGTGPTTPHPESTSYGPTVTKNDIGVAKGQGAPAQSKIDAVARWANSVPEHYKALLRDAGHTLTHHNVSSDAVHPGLKANARFHEPSRTIESFREGTEHNVLHEMGHAVDRSLGARLGRETPLAQVPKLGAMGAKRSDRSMQTDFLDIFTKYRDSGVISGNMATAPHELFAEAFALRHNPTLKGYLERRMPELAGFFDRLDDETRSPGATASSAAVQPAAQAADAAVAHQQAQAELAQYRSSKDRSPNPWAPHLSPPVGDAKDRALAEKATRAQLAHQAVQAQQQQEQATAQQQATHEQAKEMVRLKAETAQPKDAIKPLSPLGSRLSPGQEITKEHIQAKVMRGEHLTREEKGFVLNGYRMPKPKTEEPTAPQKSAQEPPGTVDQEALGHFSGHLGFPKREQALRASLEQGTALTHKGKPLNAETRDAVRAVVGEWDSQQGSVTPDDYRNQHADERQARQQDAAAEYQKRTAEGRAGHAVAHANFQKEQERVRALQATSEPTAAFTAPQKNAEKPAMPSRADVHQRLSALRDAALTSGYDRKQAQSALDGLSKAYEGYDKAGRSQLNADIAGRHHDAAKDTAQRLLTSNLSTGNPTEVAYSRALHHLAQDSLRSAHNSLREAEGRVQPPSEQKTATEAETPAQNPALHAYAQMQQAHAQQQRVKDAVAAAARSGAVLGKRPSLTDSKPTDAGDAVARLETALPRRTRPLAGYAITNAASHARRDTAEHGRALSERLARSAGTTPRLQVHPHGKVSTKTLGGLNQAIGALPQEHHDLLHAYGTHAFVGGGQASKSGVAPSIARSQARAYGVYAPELREVHVHPGAVAMGEERAAQTLHHELGHAADHALGALRAAQGEKPSIHPGALLDRLHNPAQTSEVAALHAKHKDNEYLSLNMRKNPEEFFADAYALHHTKPERLEQAAPDVSGYMQRLDQEVRDRLGRARR